MDSKREYMEARLNLALLTTLKQTLSAPIPDDYLDENFSKRCAIKFVLNTLFAYCSTDRINFYYDPEKEGDRTCLICEKKFEKFDVCRIPDCEHLFHATCICRLEKEDMSLKCPICNTDIVSRI